MQCGQEPLIVSFNVVHNHHVSDLQERSAGVPVEEEIVGLVVHVQAHRVLRQDACARALVGRAYAHKHSDVAPDLDEVVVELAPYALGIDQHAFESPHFSAELPDHHS